jgi:ankyrin repeat protein
VENPTRGLFESEQRRGEAPLPQGPSNASATPLSKVETGLSPGPKATSIPPLAALIARLSRPNKSLIRAIEQSDYLKAREILNDESKLAWISVETFGRALYLAATHGVGRVVDLLLEKGADINAADQNGYVALFRASECGKEEVVRLLLEKGADINAANNLKQSSLFVASRHGQEQVVRLLLERDADVNSADMFHESSLFVASRGGHKQVVRLLLEKGADVNAVDRNYRSSMWIASQKGHEQIVQLLLKNGADMDGALEVALRYGNERVVKVLEQHTSRLEQETNPQAVMEIVKFYQEGHSDVWVKMGTVESSPNQHRTLEDDGLPLPVSKDQTHSLKW